MKSRATVVCRRGGRFLLVAREQGRWSLPGGTIETGELPVVAARRELEEETAIVAPNLLYLFEIEGPQKQHLVFYTEVPDGTVAEPRNEIARCRWVDLEELAALEASVPTLDIVQMTVRHQFVAIAYPADRDAPLSLAWGDGPQDRGEPF